MTNKKKTKKIKSENTLEIRLSNMNNEPALFEAIKKEAKKNDRTMRADILHNIRPIYLNK